MEAGVTRSRRKVVVVGAGSVGTTYIYALLQTGLASEIARRDLNTYYRHITEMQRTPPA